VQQRFEALFAVAARKSLSAGVRFRAMRPKCW
jgi:hypothetical protein